MANNVFDDECYDTNFDKCKAVFDQTYDAKGSAEDTYQRSIDYGNASFEQNGAAEEALSTARSHMDSLMEWSEIPSD